MHSENKIPLSQIQNRIAERTNDPDPKGAFEAAFYMWKWHCIRHQIHKRQFFSQVLQKGWLKREHADHFWACLFNENHY